MKKTIILFFLLLTIKGFSQNFNLDIKKLVLFPKSKIADIEEYLILKDWYLHDIKFKKREKFLMIKEKTWKVYEFSYNNELNEEISTIEISVYNNEDNEISLKTSEKNIYKGIIKELRSNNFKIKNSGIGYVSFPEDYEVGKTIIGDSFVKKYKNNWNLNINLYTNKYIKIINYDSSTGNISYENAGTKYELTINSENRVTKSKNQTKSEDFTVKKNISYPNNNYCNESFLFCIKYPKDFIPNGESQNGDGQSFYSKDRKTKISAWGNLVTENISTLNKNFERDTKNENITYSTKNGKYYVISGIKNGKIFYQKTLQKNINYLGNNENTDILITYRIEYPIELKDKYNYYCNKINNELK